jgi:hypothetical protein
VRGKDDEYEGELSEFGKRFVHATRGTGGMTTTIRRPTGDVFGGKVTRMPEASGNLISLVPFIPT